MVISFSVQEAREQLLRDDIVYTYRWHRRAFFDKEEGESEVEDTWANKGRGTKKIADVRIEEIGQMFPIEPNLQPYLYKSGFNEITEWQNRIIEHQSGNGIGWLYKVTKTQEAQP